MGIEQWASQVLASWWYWLLIHTQVDVLCACLTALGSSVSMDPAKVGAWCMRKDAAEAPAAAGNTMEAARVLGHRRVNSRTMDRVYRADLRTHDLGRYWTGRPEVKISEPLSSISAERVPAAAAIIGMGDVPADAPERLLLLQNDVVKIAEQELSKAALSVFRFAGTAAVDHAEAVTAKKTEQGARAAAQLEEADRVVKCVRTSAMQKAKKAYSERLQAIYGSQ